MRAVRGILNFEDEPLNSAHHPIAFGDGRAEHVSVHMLHAGLTSVRHFSVFDSRAN
jgi:hypothetical protein